MTKNSSSSIEIKGGEMGEITLDTRLLASWLDIIQSFQVAEYNQHDLSMLIFSMRDVAYGDSIKQQLDLRQKQFAQDQEKAKEKEHT